MYCMKCVTVLCIRVVSVVIKRSSCTLSGVVHTGNKGTTPSKPSGRLREEDENNGKL